MSEVMNLRGLDHVQKQTAVKKGTILLSATHGQNCIFVLHQGSVGVYHPNSERLPTDRVRMNLISRPQYIGFESYLAKDKYIPTFKCDTDSVVSVYPFDDLKKFASSSKQSFISVVRMMLQGLGKVANYNNRLASMADALFVYNEKFSKLLSSLDIQTANPRFASYAQKLEEEISIDNDPMLFIKKSYDETHYRKFNIRDFSLAKELLVLNCQKEFENIMARNLSIATSLFDMLLMEYDNLYKSIHRNLESLDKEMCYLVVDGDSMLAEIQGNEFKFSGEQHRQFFSRVYSFLVEHYFDDPLVTQLYGEDKINPRLQLDIAKSGGDLEVEVEEEEEQEAAQAESVQSSGGGYPISNEFRTFLSGGFKNLDDTGFRKFLKKVNKFYIDAWSKTFLRMEGKKEKESWMILFLDRGILSRDTLGKKELTKIVQYHEGKSKDYEIHNLHSWMITIWEEKNVPSNNDMGQSYRKFIAHEMRTWSQNLKKAYESKTEEELKHEKFDFEMKNMVATASRIVNESPLRAVFPLCKLNYTSSDMGNYVYKQDVEKLVNEIRSYDYSLFYREVLFRASETKNAILQEEVKPIFIILPTVGHRVVFWQEMVENKKTSKARIILPMIFVGDFRRAMLNALGSFRWELCKAVKGVAWSDPIDGGLTGSFTDYISFYKKNNQLTMEAKEKLADLIRNSRNNYKTIFAAQYIDWIEYEREGLVRLNSVEREFFVQYVPFNKKIREKLKKLPAYERLMTRHENLQKRAINTTKNSFRKMVNPDGKYPEMVQNYIDFLEK